MSKKANRNAILMGLLIAGTQGSNAELIAYWPFDENDGDVAHDIVGGYDGQIASPNWYTPGKMGESAIEGSGGSEIACGPGPSPTTDDLTLAWWMIDNHDSYGTIMDKSVTGSGYGYNILVRPRNEDSPLRFRIGGWQSYGGWGAECRVPADAYADGEWVHIVCTYDSATDTASIYVNGELPENGVYNPKTGIAGPGGYCEGVNHVDTPLFIRGGEETFNGVLDEVAIWDEALSAEDVKTVYQSGVLALGAGPALSLDVQSSGADLAFSWDSQPGMLYNLRSSTDLSSDPATWEVVAVEGSPDIASTPPRNMLSITRPGDPVRFYQVEEFPLPPVTIFSDDLESGQGAWTLGVDGSPGTEWELGTPSAGAPGANSGVNCFGTNLDGAYEIDANVWLRSPAIDLTGASAATLNYAEFKDIEQMFDSGTINIVDASDDSFIVEVESAIEGLSTEWETVSFELPAEALDKNIKIEFRLTSDDFTNLAGWYIDDISVTTPAP